jgi:trk system potassium uptake protein TrkH
VLPVFGALPLWLAVPGLSLTDAYFEATSAFTATGATALTGWTAAAVGQCLALLHDVRWRAGHHRAGGGHPAAAGRGRQPAVQGRDRRPDEGPEAHAPHRRHRARHLGHLRHPGHGLHAGLPRGRHELGDAFMHMCTTVSLGGFSRYDASFGHWNSPQVEAVAIVFMLLAGVNLVLYFVAWRARSLAVLWRNAEVQAFVGALAGSIALISGYLWLNGAYAGYPEALRHTAFHVVSIATTTGYAATTTRSGRCSRRC